MENPSKKQGLNAGAAIPAGLEAVAGPAPDLRPRVAGLSGESASGATLEKLERAAAELKAVQAAPFLKQALNCIRGEDAQGAAKHALKALELDETNGIAWRLLGIAREKAGDFANAISCFEAALQYSPDHGEIANDIGRLAYRLDHKDLAAKLFAHFHQSNPQIADGANNLACVLRDQNLYDDAIGVLKDALGQHQEDPMLWNTLGTVLCEQGDAATSVTFFSEALRLDPQFAKARYNLGNAAMAMGDIDTAEEHCEASMSQSADPSELAMMRMARSTIRLNQGRIGEGWDDYEARLDPYFLEGTHFWIDAPAWTPETDLSGKHLLVMGEQGLGDEVLFSNLLPDLLDAVGPEGKLSIAVEPRLVTLYERSFPTANVGPHATYAVNGRTVRGAPFVEAGDPIDVWTPMGSPLTRFRRSVDAFPDRKSFLKPDVDRIAYWRGVLDNAPAGLKVGILWKSMKLTGSRLRQFSPFETWGEALRTPGVTFVNLQYGDVEAELAQAREMGIELWTPPGIDLKNDLDDLAALTCALDLVLGFANATSNIAAACGARTWWICSPTAWTLLGTDRMPWYPGSRVFAPEVHGEWGPALQGVAKALLAKA